MKFNEFKKKYQKQPIILSKTVVTDQNDQQNELNQLNRWVQKGLLIRLRRGMYIFESVDRKINPDLNYIANQLYEPSYVSLEYALNFYGLIPESVKNITCITTRKTNVFQNDFGVFIYQHIKPQAFRGFIKMGDSKMSFYMAEPEKAIADFVYLHLSQFDKKVEDVFEKSYRLQNIDGLNQNKLLDYGAMFKSKKLLKALKVFGRMIEEAK